MASRFVLASVAALALAAGVPAGAQARTPCPAEASPPTAGNLGQVSDAVVCLTNEIRASYGLAAFRRDARLDAAARLHSEDMAARDYFAHVTPEGLTPTDRATAQGYGGGVGENIAAGHANARAVMIGWMASAGHCRNILGVARDIGVGTATASRPYYTQSFGDHAFGAEGAAAASCPHAVDLDALPPPPLAAIAAAPATSLAGPPASAPPAAAPGAPARASARAPVLGRLRLSERRLRRGRAATVTYTLSARARVALRVERRAGGRWRTLRGQIAATTGRAGANRVTFRARLGARALAPGRYRLRATATAGSTSRPRWAGFRVVRR